MFHHNIKSIFSISKLRRFYSASSSPKLTKSLPCSPSTIYRLPSTKSGFTLVEMLIVAPIVILIIGVFISAIVSMTGSVLSVRGANTLDNSIQDALKRIDQDVKLSNGYLATNSITLTPPQGYDNVTSSFNNAGANGTMLILNSNATISNPLGSTREYVYADSPNTCGSAEKNQNPALNINTVYFVKNNTLWRRIIAPSDYAAGKCDTPWQQPSCVPGYTAVFCKTQDTRLVDGIAADGFDIGYYTSSNTETEIANTDNSQTALDTASSIKATISATKTIAGREVSKTGTIRSKKVYSSSENSVIPIITQHPLSTTTPVLYGTDTSFIASFSIASATKQWQVSTDSGANWTNLTDGVNNITGATSSTLTVGSVTNTMDGYKYRAVFTNGSDTYYSSAARLAVQDWFWNSLTLTSPWLYFGTPYNTPGYRKTKSGVVVLKGLIKRVAGAVAGEVIATLPVSYRPSDRLIFANNVSGNNTGRVDVDSAGQVIYEGGTTTGSFSLDDIRFIPSKGRYSSTPVNAFQNNWHNFGSIYGITFAPASYVVDDVGRVHTQGLITPGTLNSLITDLPSNLKPSEYMIMPSVTSTGYANYGIQYNWSPSTPGYSKFVSRAIGTDFLSINTMYYPATYDAGWIDLQTPDNLMLNNWTRYTLPDPYNVFSKPAYRKSADGIVSLKGIVSSGTCTSSTNFFILPDGFRPLGRTVHSASYQKNSDGVNYHMRIDVVETNGYVKLMIDCGANVWDWISLDGISFYAE